MFDVLIVGAGPVGSRTACQLAKSGYRVAVLERRTGTGQKPCCTGIVSQECLAQFEVPSTVIYRLADSARIFAPSGEFLRVARPAPQAGILNRPAFDQMMAERAQSQGAEYFLNCRVEQITVSSEMVRVEVLEKERSRILETKSVVLATGFSSFLVNKLGFPVTGYCTGGAQIEIETAGVEEVEVYFDQSLAPGFFAWLVPTSPGKCLAGLLTRKSPGMHLRNWLSELKAQGKLVSGDSGQIRHGGIPLRPLSRTHRDRILVVGDAAGQVKPTTGGGIYFGLLCADIAAEVLDQALQSNDLSSRRLSIYEKEWRKKIEPELNIEYFARRAYEHLSNKLIDSLISRLKSKDTASSLLNSRDFSFDWHGNLMLKALRQAALARAGRFFKLSGK